MANEKQLQLKTKVFITRNTREYEGTVDEMVTKRDTVLEVGCQEGALTQMIAVRSKKVIGIDHVQETIEQARAAYPSFQFEVLDGFNVLDISRLTSDRIDIVYIDMSQLAGYSSRLDTICLLNAYSTILQPEKIIVKNKSLKALTSQCLAWDPSPEGIERAKKNQSKPTTKFVATRGVDEFRASIPVWVNENDDVLEIGCEWGTSTELIAPVARSVIGTDVSSKCIDKARSLRPDIEFGVLNGFDVRAVLEMRRNFSKIYIDISGLSGYRSLLDVLNLLTTYETVLKPAAIIIKSGSLKQFATHYFAWYQSRDEVQASI